jgi:selenium-binding protein 1
VSAGLQIIPRNDCILIAYINSQKKDVIMKKNFAKLFVLTLVAISFVACQEDDFLPDPQDSFESNSLKSGKMKKGFVHGVVIDIDGEGYYFAGAPDGEGGAIDVPGHSWVQAGPTQIVGKHYNTGPFGSANWWSSDADDGALLYTVHGIIDTWSVEKASYYASRGYVHRHEFVSVLSPDDFHPSKVVWLKHTAVSSFTLDGGPGAPNPPYEHYATPGVDLEFPNNGFVPYP